MAKTSDLQRYLNNNGISYTILQHDPAFTAHSVAVAAHVPDKDLLKSIVLQIDGRYWMGVLRADHRMNTASIRHSFGARQVNLAHEEDLSSLFPDCQLGTMPPFGNLYGLPVLIDEAILDDEEIFFNACCNTRVIKMKLADYRRLVNPLVGRYAEPPSVREEAW